MTREEATYGKVILHVPTGMLIKVHHVADDGGISFFAQLLPKTNKGKLVKDDYNYYFGYIQDCVAATYEQRMLLERWIIENTGKEEMYY